MKYLLLAYGSQRDVDALDGAGDRSTVPADEVAAIGDYLEKFQADLTESGELVDAQGLTAPARARQVQHRAGAQVVTDGPFAETEEVLVGYWIVDCAGLERATEIAARLDECPGPASQVGIVIRSFL